MKYVRKFLGLATISLIASGCATPGRFWDSNATQWISEDLVVDRLRRADLVLVGELHDSRPQRDIQFRLIEALLREGRRPALVFEQFDLEHQRALDAARRRPGITAEDLAVAGQIDRRGWDWPRYRPLVELALRNDLPIVAANVSRATARRVMADGFGALGTDLPASLAGGRIPLDAAERSMISKEIVASHCNMIGTTTADRMALAQQARDAVMAEVLGREAARGAVLIAGNGHVRRDVGVPRYLAPDLRARTVVIGLLEGRALPHGREPFDFVWLTPERTRRGDPCASFKPPAETPAAPR